MERSRGHRSKQNARDTTMNRQQHEVKTMDTAQPMIALPEPTAPGIYRGWICRNCNFPIKVWVGRCVETAGIPYTEIRCRTCDKILVYAWMKRILIEVS